MTVSHENPPTAAEVHAELARRRRRRRRWLLAAVVLLPLVAILALWLPSLAVRREVQAELARIAAAGEPVTAADVDRMYVADTGGPEATRRWLAALDQLKLSGLRAKAVDLPIVGQVTDEIPPPGQPWGELAAAQQLLLDHQELLDEMHAAAAEAGVCRYPIDLTQGFAALLPDVEWIREALRVFQLEVHVRAHEGDAHGAVRAIEAMHRVGETLADEPLLVSQLVRIACLTTTHATIREIVPHVELTPEDRAVLEALLASEDFGAPLRRAMLGERAVGSSAFDDPAVLAGGGVDPSGLVLALWRATRWRDEQLYLQYMGALIEATDLPISEALAATDQAVEHLESTIDGGNALAKFRYFMTRMVAPSLGAVIDARGRAEASRDATLVVLAIDQFRRAQGRLPASLDELVPDFLPAVPLDPFDGQPLRYALRSAIEGAGQGEQAAAEAAVAATATEYRLYSVGRDRVDNGGNDESQDYVFVTWPAADREPDEEDASEVASDDASDAAPDNAAGDGALDAPDDSAGEAAAAPRADAGDSSQPSEGEPPACQVDDAVPQ